VSEGADGSPFIFNRPRILERITQKETSELILRQDELVVTVVEQSSPAVVSIVATKDIPVIEKFFVDPFAEDPLFRQFFGGDSGFRIPQFRQKGTQTQEVSFGTGFIVSPDGLIITNKHVVADTVADYTVLLSDGSKKPAKVLARDPMQDLAVLKIEGSGFVYLRLGDSSKVKIGQTVIAIGNALGEFRNTVSVGVVSGLERAILASGAATGPEMLQELIQTDAAINLGNSGGPLLNLRGEVVGINTAMAQGAENIGFSIPVSKAVRALDSVKKFGKIITPFLGVRYIAITKDLAEAQKVARDYGALLKSVDGESAVTAGSPAETAGLKEGDIVLEFNGTRINQEHSLAPLIQNQSVGDTITLKVFRDGKEIEVKVTLEERK
jgi:serine protease Do